MLLVPYDDIFVNSCPSSKTGGQYSGTSTMPNPEHRMLGLGLGPSEHECISAWLLVHTPMIARSLATLSSRSRLTYWHALSEW